MVSVTLSIPGEVKEKMEEFSEINWSGFVRKSIIKKTEELSKREELLKSLEKEKDITHWAVKLQRAARKGRFEELKKKGLV
jgi:hypothetical protein